MDDLFEVLNKRDFENQQITSENMHKFIYVHLLDNIQIYMDFLQNHIFGDDIEVTIQKMKSNNAEYFI